MHSFDLISQLVKEEAREIMSRKRRRGKKSQGPWNRSLPLSLWMPSDCKDVDNPYPQVCRRNMHGSWYSISDKVLGIKASFVSV